VLGARYPRLREWRLKRNRNRRATPRRHAAAMKLMHHSGRPPDRVRRSYTYANRI